MTQPCFHCHGTGRGWFGGACGVCQGTGRVEDFVANVQALVTAAVVLFAVIAILTH